MSDSLPTETTADAYRLVSRCLRLFETKYNPDLGEFGISPEIFDEILEALEGYGVAISDWTLPPIEIVLAGKARVFDLFETEEFGCIGLEAELWSEGVVREPIIHGILSNNNDGLSFTFGYIR